MTFSSHIHALDPFENHADIGSVHVPVSYGYDDQQPSVSVDILHLINDVSCIAVDRHRNRPVSFVPSGKGREIG